MRVETEVLVIGSGVAGCSAAIAADRAGADVTVVTKASKPEDTNTWWAQGGIAKVADSNGDSPQEFAEDIIEAGDGESDPEAVETLVEEGTQAVEEMLVEEFGAEFDESSNGYDLAKEGGHSERRVLHSGDATGEAVHHALLSRLDEREIEVLESHMALDLLTDDGEVTGAVVVDTEDDTTFPVSSGATVLATGGIGDVYGHTSNPEGATGDGVAMAAFADAEVDDMEYVQFHPTVHAEREYLLSEALRGEGALLIDGDGERFMPDYHEDAELAPRDVVAVRVDEHRRETGEVYLDLSPVFESCDFENEFPTAYDNLTDEEIEDRRVPVKPAEHFLCGGVVVDEHGRSSVENLYAVGETARTGVHGANRLASTSLLEGLTWGLRAGEDAAENPSPPDGTDGEVDEFNGEMPERFCEAKFERLQEIMWNKVGLRREEEELRQARTELQRLRGEVKSYARGRTDPGLYALRNAVVVGILITEAAIENDESVGCHRRVSA
ncbi:MAG: L-aspartate oxidase [Halobacteria archaeon]|nr:L-aspartate oxidase [Halobacteria archaeon]